MRKKLLVAIIPLAMRLFVIQLLVLSTVLATYATNSNGQEILNKRVSISISNMKLKEVLHKIESFTDVKFVFSSKMVDVSKKLSLTVVDKRLGDLLNQLLIPNSISYRVLDGQIVLYTKDETITGSPDGAVPISGRVIDSLGTPLAGATVQVKGMDKKVITDSKGDFTLTGVPDGATLIITYVGYLDKEIKARDGMTIMLTSQNNGLNEVVVIGYGERRKKDLTGAFVSIGTTEIEKSTAVSPQLAMQGQMAGVGIISGGGDPSARPTVRIRGVSSFNYADPLYVIDGIPIEEGGAGATVDKTNDPTRRTSINLYTIINPSDIESITVLKDASATAVYGVRGANGVILVTTKSGKKGHMRVDADVIYGTQKVPKTYSFLNTQQYVKFITDAYNQNPFLNGTTPIPIGQASKFGAVWDPSSPSYLGNSPTYDWQDVIINHSAKVRNYNVRTSGGSDNTLYNFSAGYTKNDGPFLGVNVERYSISSNVQSKIGKYLETGLNLRLIQENTHEANWPGTNDLGIYQAAPWQAIYDKNNPYGYAALWKTNQPITPTTFDISPVWESASDAFVPVSNYLGEMATYTNPFVHQTLLGSGYVQLQPIRGLKIRGTLSGEQLTISNNSFTSFDNWQFGETPANPYSGIKNATPGVRYNSVGTGSSVTTSLNKSVNIDYTRTFGKHSIDITLNGSHEEMLWKTTGVSSYVNTDNPDLRYIHVTGNEYGYNELHGHYVLIGYLARISYNYASKYYLDVLTRRDGSSRFAPGHQYGTFPAGSAAWRISQENFMQSVRFINDLKIRGGYGILGNENTTGGWQYLSVASITPPAYNIGAPNTPAQGVAYNNFANTDLTWEKLYSGNIGFDAQLFNNLSLTIDYYHKKTKGIIQSVSLTPSAGIEVPADLNIADVLNSGIEVQAGYNRTFGMVGVNLSANFTTVHNEVTSLANHTAIRSLGLEEGLPIGFIYGYKAGGIFQDQKQIDDWNKSHKDKISTQQKPGDIYFQDLYGQPASGSTAHNTKPDSLVDANDQTFLGKTIPGFYYGFNAGANYKGFDLSIFFQGVGDVKKYNTIRAAAESMNTNGRNQWTTVLHAWTQDHPSSTMPRAVYGDPNGNNRTSSRFVESAAYLRLQNVQLGYTLSNRWAEKTKVFQRLRVYVSGINLFTITKYTGVDPENALNPTTRQYLIGINSSF